MSNKYIDLSERIGEPDDVCSCYELGRDDALAYLDEHPDQMPGRTITESRLWEIEQLQRKVHNWTTRRTIQAVGIEIVPDQKPTNAELLMQLLNAHDPHRKEPTADLAAALDAAGVKAPDHD